MSRSPRALREGGFEAPAEGWTAELVTAHVARNNDLIAEVAETVAAGGGQPAYDNRAAVAESELQAFADAAGGMAGLADAVEASARRLARAWAALDETTAGYLLPVVIVDSGRVIRDGPFPLAASSKRTPRSTSRCIFEQLRALTVTTGDGAGQVRTAEPPSEFDLYELVLLIRPDSRPELDHDEAERLHSQRLGHLATMRESGRSWRWRGPLADQPDDSWRGVCFYQVGATGRARRLAELDPAVRPVHEASSS